MSFLGTVCDGFTGGARYVKNLYLASSVTSIKNLNISPNHVYCYGASPSTCDNNTFNSYNGTLHVPKGKKSIYFADEYWGQFENIIDDAVWDESPMLSTTDLSIRLGETIDLSANVQNSFPDEPFVWRSTNPNIVDLLTNANDTKNVTLSAKAIGEADIIVTYAYRKDVCHVTVKENEIKISLDYHDITIKVDDIVSITPSIVPAAASIDYSFTNSNENVALAQWYNGKIRILGVSPGTTVLTISSSDGSAVPDSCNIKVIANTLPGDVNGDGECTASDVTALYNSILYNDNSKIVNGDQNGDGNITASDVTAVYNIILGLNIAPSPRIVDSNDALRANDLTLVSGGSSVMEVALDNYSEYNAFQLDIVMPQGLKIKSIGLGDRAQGGNLDYNEIRPGVYRILSASPTCDVIENFAGTLLYVEVEASSDFTGNGRISIGNAMFVERDCTTCLVEGINVNANVATAISDVNMGNNGQSLPVNVYSIDGRLIKTNVTSATATHGLPQGFYIIGNKKVVVK